jgi:hypothetical protein
VLSRRRGNEGRTGRAPSNADKAGTHPGSDLTWRGGEGGGALAVACGSAPHLHHREKEKSMRRRPRRRLSGRRLALTREGGGSVALA